jgi:hypothetical protein
MTVDESKGLKKDTRVYWRGDAADSGIVTEISWDAVTIAWNNGKVARVTETCAKFSKRRQSRILCKGSRTNPLPRLN